MKKFLPIFFLALCFPFTRSLAVPAQSEHSSVSISPASISDAEFRAQIEADWLAEEARLGRSPEDWSVIESLFTRAHRAAEAWNLPEEEQPERLTLLWSQLKDLQKEAQSLKTGANSPSERLALYLKIRWCAREIVLLHPALRERKIAFMKQNRVIQQQFHEYSGYYFDFFNVHGGGLFILEEPGRSARTSELTGTLPRGTFTTPSLSFDGKTIYFAWCRVTDGDRPWPEGRFDASKLPRNPENAVGFDFNYFSSTRRSFHIYAVNTDGTNLRQITTGICDDTDPCELPDGRIVFMSARRGGFIRCNSHYEPLETATLHAVRKDGTELTCLSYHETDEWHPSVRPDGRLLYTRWDYVDRDATLFHGIWTSNPDGTAPIHLFGSYTDKINAHYQARFIPGTKKIIAVAGAHHAVVGGSLILIDTEKLARNPDGSDSLDAMERLTPEIPFSEVNGQWAKSFYSSPLPLSEFHFLTAFSFDPLPGMGSGYREDSRSGLYYWDRFGNKELLFRDASISSVSPMLLNTPDGRPFQSKPPIVPSILDEELAEAQQGEFFLTNVNISQIPMPEGRKITALRIFELLPKTETVCANRPSIGFANTIPARAYLGEVPVEEDGSAWFRAPARKPLYFQALDSEGRAVQGMRSNVYLQPGEKRACVGCHEPVGMAIPQQASALAFRRGPSEITPSLIPPQPLGFPALIQPILDRRCVTCHGGESSENPASPDLRGKFTNGEFSQSYENLRPYLRWYEWGRESISLITSRPGECGADMSALSGILTDENHQTIPLTDTERRLIWLWLDSNSPFYGSYQQHERQLQREGKPIPLIR